MSIKLFLFVIIILVFIILLNISQIIIVPYSFHTNIIPYLFATSFVLFLLSFINLMYYKKENSSKLFTLVIAFSLTWISILSRLDNIEFIKKIKVLDKTFYIYHDTCFPPDGMCECSYYRSLIYLKNPYLPLSYEVMETSFYTNDIYFSEGEFIIKSSEICKKDVHREERLKLR